MESTKALLGGALKRERLKQKLSQADLEEYSGIPKARISRYEHGHQLPTIETLDALADGLGMRASVLMRRAGL